MIVSQKNLFLFFVVSSNTNKRNCETWRVIGPLGLPNPRAPKQGGIKKKEKKNKNKNEGDMVDRFVSI